MQKDEKMFLIVHINKYFLMRPASGTVWICIWLANVDKKQCSKRSFFAFTFPCFAFILSLYFPFFHISPFLSSPYQIFPPKDIGCSSGGGGVFSDIRYIVDPSCNINIFQRSAPKALRIQIPVKPPSYCDESGTYEDKTVASTAWLQQWILAITILSRGWQDTARKFSCFDSSVRVRWSRSNFSLHF